MRYSKLFGKTSKNFPHDEVAVNAKLLLQGGFIDKLMAGSYSLLHLGRKVEQKIENIIREEMNSTGAEEILLPLLHPKNIWNETGRWDSARDVMYQFEKDDKEYALSFTHEEVVMDLLRKHINSYKDLPVKVYQFSTKFRNEARAKSGILRGREFLMKDLYSAHTTEADLMEYYEKVKEVYISTFKRLGLDVKVVEASGGVFTESHTHEFQVLAESGEDTIFYCENCDFAQNDEIKTVSEKDMCPSCNTGKIKVAKSIEVGNIFPLGTYYAEKMNVMFTDSDGARKPVWFASYGIGPTRVMGTVVEVHSDARGIIWPKSIAPFDVYLISIGRNEEAEKVYSKLKDAGVDVLYDNREEKGPGEKFSDADLLGIPYRVVISEKTGDKVEVKERRSDQSKLTSVEELIEETKRS